MQLDHKIGDRIRQAREDKGFTQEQLGKEIGMSAMGISYLEKGLRKIKIEDVIQIAEKLSVKESYLLESITGTSSNNQAILSMNNYRSDFAPDDSDKKEAEDAINKAFNNLFN